MHLTKGPGQSKYQYKYLALDVKGLHNPTEQRNRCLTLAGYSRVYLENADAAKEQKKTGTKMFGVRWG